MIESITQSMAQNLHVYLHDDDRDRLNRYADDEKLRLGTAVKRLVLKELDKRGY